METQGKGGVLHDTRTEGFAPVETRPCFRRRCRKERWCDIAPKRWRVGILDRVDHFFGAARKGGATLNQRFFALVALDRDRGERQAVRDHLNHPNVPCSQIDGHVGGLDRVDHLFGRGERVKSVQ